MARISIALVFVFAVVTIAAPAPGADGSIVLPHSRDIRALHRSGDVLWVGTGGGLYTFDLSTDRMERHIVTGAEIASSSVRALAARNDSVFIATDGGVSVASEGEIVPYRIRGRGRFDRVRAIDFGLGETLFLGTYGHGVTVSRGDRSWRITREDSLLDDKVYAVHQEADSTVYFATSMGLCAFRDSAWVGFQAGAGIPRGEVRALIASRSVGYYLLVAGRGVYSFNGYNARSLIPSDLFGDDDIECIALDTEDRLWAAARNGGIAVRENGRWARIGQGDPRVDGKEWTAAHADAFGVVYFGSRDGTVIAIVDERVRVVAAIEGALPTGSISDLVLDPDGGVVFLCGDRIHAYNGRGGAPEVPFGPPGLTAIAFAPDSSLWVAGRWGVYRSDSARSEFEEFRPDVRGLDPSFIDIAFDKNGHLWVSEQGGDIYRFDGELWMRIGDVNATPGLGPAALVAGADGGIWAVGDTGCAGYRGGRWKSFERASLLDIVGAPGGRVTGLTPWGLLTLDDNARWRPVALGSGPDSTTIGQWLGQNPATSLTFDAGGRVYLGTEDGVVAVGPKAVRRLRSVDGIGGKAVADLVVEGNQWLWVAFDRDGLARIPLISIW